MPDPFRCLKTHKHTLERTIFAPPDGTYKILSYICRLKFYVENN